MLLQQELTWLERQTEIEADLARLEERGTDFFHPDIVLNPYQTAPLTAMVLFQTEVPTTVQVVILAPDGTADLQYQSAETTMHRVAIYGLYADCTTRVQLTLATGEQQEIQIATGALPVEVAQGTAEGTLSLEDWIFTVPLTDTALPAAYDKDGICRWYTTQSLAYQLVQLANGHLLTCGPKLLSPPYSATAIWEMDILGKIYKEYRLPGGFCNGFFVMENGNILALHQFFNRATAADLCVEIDAQTGEIIKEWDIRALLPMSKGGSTSQNGSDWFHANGISYQAEDDAVIISGKHQDCIISIGYTSGQLNWILGDSTGWPEELAAQYFLTPVGDNFTWFYEPGTVQVLGGQRILCFDNGHLRCKKAGTPIPAEERYSRVVCYQLDKEQCTVEQLWAYGQEAGNALYSPYLSNAVLLADDTCLMNFGGIGWYEGTPTEPPVFFIKKDCPEAVMQTQILLQQQNEISYKLTLQLNCYYANKLQTSSLQAETDRNAGCVLGSWYGNDEFDLEMEWEEAGLLADTYGFSARLTAEQLIVAGSFIQGEMVVLLLENENGKHIYYMQTTRAPYLTASAQTYAKGAERLINYVVDLRNLSGKYEICICLDDKKYHTDVWFVCE